MFTIQTKHPDKLDALRQIKNPQVGEVVIIRWRTGAIAYAPCDYAHWPNYQGLQAQLGNIPLEAKVYASKPNWFQELMQTGDISDDEANLQLLDVDRAIRRKAIKGKGTAVEICYYFPQVDWLVPEWWGQLRAPKKMGGPLLNLTAATGLRSPKLQLPRKLIGAIGCQAIFPPEANLTAAQIAENPCRYDRHLPGGTFGNLDGGDPFLLCPKTINGCLERLEAPGVTRASSYFGLDAANESTLVGQSKGSPIRASARGNNTNLADAQPWVFGEYLIRQAPVLKILPEVNRNNPDQAALRVLALLSHGPIGEIGESRINNVVVKPQDQNLRLGDYRQPPTGFSDSILNFNLTAHAYLVIIGGPWSSQTADQTQTQTKIKRGYQATRVFTDAETYTRTETTNRLWVIVEAYTDKVVGHGYSEKRFNMDALLYAAEWCGTNVQAISAQGTVVTTKRSEFNGAFYGRQASQEIRDACLFGGLTYPFMHEGHLYILPLETADLFDVPVITDAGDERNIMTDGKGNSLIEWSMKDDDELAYSILMNFEDSENDFLQRPLIFKDINAIFEEGQNLGEPIVREPREPMNALGITKYGQAIRLGWRMLNFGQFDTGGLYNNATVMTSMPYTWVKKLGLHLFKVVKVLSDKVQPECEFEYFRIISMKRSAGLVYDLVLQAYNHVLYQLLDQDEITPGLIKEGGNATPISYPGGSPLELPRPVHFVDVQSTPDSICFTVEELTAASLGSGGTVTFTLDVFTNRVNIVLAGKTYTSTAASGLWTANMTSALSLQGDGWVKWPLSIGSDVAETSLVGFDPSLTHTGDWRNVRYGLNNYLGVYHRFISGSWFSSGVAAKAGDLLRLRRAGSTLYYEKSSDNAATWQQLFQDTNVTGELFVHALLRKQGDALRDVEILGFT